VGIRYPNRERGLRTSNQETAGVGKTRQGTEAVWRLVEVIYRLLTFLRLGVSVGIAPIPRGWRLMTASLLLGLLGEFMRNDQSTPDNGKAVTGEQGAQPHAPAISLPKGGGAIRGIGEKFATNPRT
jgi:hypothetical protein